MALACASPEPWDPYALCDGVEAFGPGGPTTGANLCETATLWAREGRVVFVRSVTTVERYGGDGVVQSTRRIEHFDAPDVGTEQAVPLIPRVDDLPFAALLD